MATQERLKELAQKKAKLEQQIAALKSREAAKERKEDTRLKVLVGAAMLADAKMNPQTGVFVQDILEKAITADRDRDFLRRKGWLKENPKRAEEKTAGQ